MRRLVLVIGIGILAMLLSSCGLKLPDHIDLPTINPPTAETADPAHEVEVVSFTQVGNSLSVRLRNPNPDVGLVRSPFELAMIDQAGAVIATEGQGGVPGASINTIYQLPPGGEYGLDILGVPNGRTVASVELTVLGSWFKWDTVNPPLVTVTGANILPDPGYSGPSVTGRLTLDKDGPLNVVVGAFVKTSAGTVVSDVRVECMQTGQRRTFQTSSIADTRGPYSLDRIVAYPTAVKNAGPKFDPNCSSAPASAPPRCKRSRTTPPTPSPQSPPVPSSSPPPYTPRPALTGDPAANIDYLLLTSTEVRSIVGGSSDLQVDGTMGAGPSDNSALVEPPTCVGVIFTAEQSVYGGTDFVALRDKTLRDRDGWGILVQQTVAVYPTPDQALALLTSSEIRWRECARGEVSYRVPGTNGEVGWNFNLGDVELQDDVLTVSMAGINRSSGNSACQQAVGVRANVVVGVRSCNGNPDIPINATVADPNLAGTSAKRLAVAILDGIS